MDDPAPLENIIDDLETRLLDVTDGIYAITHMTRNTFKSPVEADCARSGIRFIALKLDDDMRVLRERIIEASDRVKGKEI